MSNARYKIQDGNLVKIHLPAQFSQTGSFYDFIPKESFWSKITCMTQSAIKQDAVVFALNDDSQAGLILEGEALSYQRRWKSVEDTITLSGGAKSSAMGFRLTSFVVKKHLQPESVQVRTEVTQIYSQFGPVPAPENIIHHEDTQDIATSSVVAELVLLGDRHQAQLALMLMLVDNHFLSQVNLSEVFKVLTSEVQADFCMHIATQDNGKIGKAWADELCDVIAQLPVHRIDAIFEKLSSAWDISSQQKLYQRFVDPELVNSRHGGAVNFCPEILKAYYDIAQIIKGLEAQLTAPNSSSAWRSHAPFMAPPVTIAAKIAAANCLSLILINGNSPDQVEQNKQHTAALKTPEIQALAAKLLEAGFVVITDSARATTTHMARSSAPKK
jgi:hypothetical protein